MPWGSFDSEVAFGGGFALPTPAGDGGSGYFGCVANDDKVLTGNSLA
jgi:hypothetical protein